MDLSQYLEIFIDETKEHLQTLNDQVLILEAEPENIDTVNEIFRAAHSLKGMAGTMGFKRMQRLTHDMENVFSEIRNGKLNVNADMVDIVFKCLDAIEGYLTNIIESADEGTEDNEELIGLLNDALADSSDAAPAPEKKKEAEPEKASDAPAADEDKCKFRSVPIADFEKNAMLEAKEKGMHVYAVTVYIQESCLLKAARAFLVFKGVEEKGEVIKSHPSAQDIEDEKFEQDFSMFIVSEKSLDEIKKTIENVSEIQEAVIEEYEIPDTVTETAPKSEAPKNKAEEAPKPAASEKKEEKKAAPAKAAGKPVVNRSVRVDIEKLDDLMNLVSELIIAKNGLVSVSGVAAANDQKFNEQIEYLERITTNLHESVMKTRMVPIESVVNRFPRMIRDLSKKLNKEMELIMTGEDTELDRTVIDEIGDPLMHMLRNAADHGLESTIDRLRIGKPQIGTIRLDAYQDGNNVTIEVSDDGAGIDVEKIKQKAIDKGAITEEQAEYMSEKEAVDLLFQPAFSTAEKISDVSGRGVGLDVVKNKIEGLGGDVEVASKLGEGTTFIVRLPLTLAIIQALMVDVCGEKYALPLNSIVTLEEILPEDIKYVHTKEVINLRGQVIPLVRLNEVLDVPDNETGEDDSDDEGLVVVIVKKGDKQAGLVISKLIGQQEIVIKPLGKFIHVPKLISGATILGNGDVALIIDSNTLV
ncbi:MAG: chemotaxis protein CheA [Clostridium sp.]|nr:chemotaxis protein CheA [Clostridium sp.]MCM1172667.1 chemotaxis protein CheA [Clostridium sp.]MCM1207673.1 chemotaxis protein CheA [Ruminococcus sp.]